MVQAVQAAVEAGLALAGTGQERAEAAPVVAVVRPVLLAASRT